MFLNTFPIMVLLIIKIGIEVLLVFFIIFLLILLKQLRAMGMIIKQQQLFAILKTFAIVLLIATGMLFLLTLVLI